MIEFTLQHKKRLGDVRLELDRRSFVDDIVPPVVTEVIQALASEFGPLPPVHVPLRIDDLAVYGWPADGINEKIRAHGGSIQFGWRLREWPGILLTGEPHAAWVDADGTLIDITPGVVDGDTSLFVPVTSHAEPFGFDQLPPPRYRMLYLGPDRSEAVAERIALMKTGQRAYEERRAQKAGKTLEEWIHGKYYSDPLPDRIAKFIGSCGAFDAVLPTIPSLIAADPYAEEEEQPEPAPPDAGGTTVETDTPGEVSVETGTVDDAEPANTPGGMVFEAESDDSETDEYEDSFDEIWLAEETLDRASWKRNLCREEIMMIISRE
jgi:hypothetical protein